MSDGEIERLVDDFVTAAAVLAQRAGFDFVDIKHCHGYLGHEFLSAVDRPGQYGGSFENRTRFLREIVAGIRAEAPGLAIAVRFSAVDFVPFEDGDDDRPRPVGARRRPLSVRLRRRRHRHWAPTSREPLAFLDLLRRARHRAGLRLGRRRVQLPHHGALRLAARRAAQAARGPARRRRPADHGRAPSSSGAPGAGVRRQRLLVPAAVAAQRRPGRRQRRRGRLRRHRPLSFSYPDICADILAGRPLQQKRICTTCGYCDVAPGFGVGSGCYTLDEFYRAAPGVRAAAPGREGEVEAGCRSTTVAGPAAVQEGHMTYIGEAARQTPVYGEVDVVVCGGGVAGVAAAVCAARGGADVLLVERYGYLGGLATGGLVITVPPLDNGLNTEIRAEARRGADLPVVPQQRRRRPRRRRSHRGRPRGPQVRPRRAAARRPA